ncbi:hypothetical protein N474_18670 [Pseudoalteromonas luteoviolacea CPMOR-2]|uniref:hypothetical protein n=1 Tax=Pseudoalteromonas luteoviolacea TaxID=43657 RepID=UPI0007B0442D|nr:hypothetical protein [Pseudoalteromonas luteoviolacea]KZN53977.1 hypothetical protein N474_18670 [Pseudoalteromonas luteoviolacea CPMOR-2]
MKKFLTFILILFTSFYSFSSTDISLMSGKWDCSVRIEEGSFSSYFKIIDSYNVESYKFTSEGSVALKYKSTSIFEFEFQSQGTFTVEGDVFKPIFTEVDVELVSGDMLESELNKFKNDLLNSKRSYKTLKINNKERTVLDLTDNSESTCLKI